MKNLRWYIFFLVTFAIGCWIYFHAEEISAENPDGYAYPGLMVAIISAVAAALAIGKEK